MSKGSKPRPRDVDDETYAKNWDAIFGKKSEPKPECPCLEMDETGCCKNCGCPILAG